MRLSGGGGGGGGGGGEREGTAGPPTLTIYFQMHVLKFPRKSCPIH